MGAAMAVPVRDEFRHLVVTARDRQWGLYVTAAGTQFIPPGAHFRATGHCQAHDYLWQHGRVLREYALVYVIRGEGQFESKLSGRLAVKPGSVIRLFPDVWHRYRPIEDVGWDSYWVTFRGDYADRLLERGFLGLAEPVIETGVDELILRPFTTLLDRVRSQPLGLQQLIATDTLAIIAGIRTAMQRRQTASHVREAVRQAKLAIEAAEGPPTIERLAADSGLSRSHFYQVFKSCTGVSPYQYHLQLRMGRARELLRGSALSVKQIAAVLRFPSTYQFSRIFRKKTGTSPSHYRRGRPAAKVPRAAGRRRTKGGNKRQAGRTGRR
jgi:AraC-like DNA-binding protein